VSSYQSVCRANELDKKPGPGKGGQDIGGKLQNITNEIKSLQISSLLLNHHHHYQRHLACIGGPVFSKVTTLIIININNNNNEL